MSHRALNAFAHVSAPPQLRRIGVLALCGLLFAALGYAVRVRRQLERSTASHSETTRALSRAVATLRERDSTLTRLAARVDTVYVPVTRFVVVREPASHPAVATPALEAHLASASSDVNRVDAAVRVCAEPVMSAQAATTADASAYPPSFEPMRRTARTLLTTRSPRTLVPDAAYFTLLATADLGNAWLHVDRDPGGYMDTWNTQDKLAHGAMGALLSMSAIDAGVRPAWAVALTCAGAAGFEWSQGYASRKDLIAGCAGAAVGAGIHWSASKLVGHAR